MNPRFLVLVSLLTLSIVAAPAGAQTPLGTAFTYQGQLKEAGEPATGAYDFQFTLYDADVGGNVVGSPAVIGDWPVEEGLFTVWLDFGSAAFAGQARWLEVAVRPGASGGPYTTLSPRQELTAVPYALYALNGAGGESFWQAGAGGAIYYNGGNVGIGIATPARDLEVRKSVNDLVDAGVANYGAGTGARALLAVTCDSAQGSFEAYSAGYAEAFLQDRAALLSEVGATGLSLAASDPNGDIRFYTGGLDPAKERMVIDSSGNVGIGTDSPNRPLTVLTGTNQFGLTHTDGTVRMSTYTDTTTGGYLGTETSHALNFYTNNSAARLTITPQGQVGIGTYTPGARLHIGGTPGVDGLMFPDGTLQTTAATGGAAGWSLTGNAGTDPNTDFLGTTDNTTLNLKVNAACAFRIEPAIDPHSYLAPNLIGGHAGNAVTAGAAGATVFGVTWPGYVTRVTDHYGTVGGGVGNQAGDDDADPNTSLYATVSGGAGNVAGALAATVGGGLQNVAGAVESTVAGGYSNYAPGAESVVGGGSFNHATGVAATIGGGYCNDAIGTCSTVSGGRDNEARGGRSTVAGGFGNAAGGDYSFAAGFRAKVRDPNEVGDPNGPGDEGTFIWADANYDPNNPDFTSTGPNQFLVRATGGVAFFLDTDPNSAGALRIEPATDPIYGLSPNVIAGYGGNSVTAGAVGAVIAGGGAPSDGVPPNPSAQPNRVTDDYGAVGGGWGNQAGDGDTNSGTAMWATVAGGQQNTASGSESTVSGGRFNHATNHWSTVSGGDMNWATGRWNTVGGGGSNRASGDYGTIPGGYNNVAGGYLSFAAGCRARVRDPNETNDPNNLGDYGTFVWADSTDANFVSSGPDQFLVRAAGGVGINTNTPSSPLTVNGAIESLTGGFKFPDDTVQATAGVAGSGYTGYLPKFTAAKTVGNSILCETAAGKIGINDYSPDAALDITTTFADTLWLRGPGTFTTNGRIRFQDTSPEVYIQNDIDGGLLLSVNENYGGRLAITGGNVGIGTLEPTSALSVAGDADFTGYVGIGTPNPNNALTVAGDADFMAAVGIGTPTPVNDLDVAGAMAIGATYAGTNAAPTNGLIVEGHVGIGETSPLAKLHVQNVDLGVTSGMTYDTLLVENTDAQFGLYSNSSGSWGSGLSLAEVNAGVLVNKWGLVRQTGASGLMKVSFGTDANPANNTAVMTFLSGGNVGVGVPDPSEKLDTNGTARLRGIGSSSGTAVIADVNGKLWKQSSSLRYKHNIADLPSTGEAVLALRPVSFNWNSTGEPDIGVIAEEVEQVLPDLVIRDAAGQPDGVRYDKVALYLLGVVKDQREQITAQQDELADLRARLERIEAALGGQATPRTGGVR